MTTEEPTRMIEGLKPGTAVKVVFGPNGLFNAYEFVDRISYDEKGNPKVHLSGNQTICRVKNEWVWYNGRGVGFPVVSLEVRTNLPQKVS
jgi:hypothetical protein